MKGLTLSKLTPIAGAKAGGVGIQTPSPAPGVYGVTTFAPSFARRARIAAAAERPVAMPSALALPSGMAASAEASAGSSALFWFGILTTRAPLAAGATAASGEAVGGATAS